MSDDSTSELLPIPALQPFEELPLTDERKAELAPKLRVLLHDLARIRELETFDGQPATLWPWEEAIDVR